MRTAPEDQALAMIKEGGGMLFPFFRGYAELGALLDALPPDEWRRDEAVLGGLVLHLLKRGHATRAKSYLNAAKLEFEKTDQFEFLNLLLALHLGEPVSEAKLTLWRRLERTLPVSQPLLLGLYYNAMMAMFVRLNRLAEARVAGQQAISCYREHGHIYLEHFIHIHLSDIDVIEGRLRSARRGLTAAERCLAQAGVLYSNEMDVIEVVRLAIDYESGQLERVCNESSRLRESLMNGDSWSELFFQLARITVLSKYFTDGLAAAQQEIEIFQADYARRHIGAPVAIDGIHALVFHLDWQPNEVERVLNTAAHTSMDSAIGDLLVSELDALMRRSAGSENGSPRSAVVRALQHAQNCIGHSRKLSIESAIRLAYSENQIAPFLENRDAFLGVSSDLAKGKFARGNRNLSRFANKVLRLVDQCYVVPEKLRAAGLNRRQYRVAAALQSGASNKQIARQLGSSEATVKYHLTSIFRLTGSSTRYELIELMEEIEFI